MKKEISEENVSGFVNIPLLIFEKGNRRRKHFRSFKIFKYTFLIFEKGDKRRKCVRICKYIFFNIWKRGWPEKLFKFFRICKYTFLIFEKEG